MRSLRWLLLVAMAVIAAAVFGIYRAQRIAAGAKARPLPSVLPLGTVGKAFDYRWGQSANGKPKYEVIAKDATQLEGNKTEYEDIELQLFQKDGQHYDRVRSPHAEMSTTDHKLYAPGEAEITLDVPVSGDPPRPLTSIKAAGLNYDTETGHAVTDKPVAFTFDGGDGTSIGASYDPQTFELHLNQNVSVNMRGKDPKSKPMLVEAGELTYNEKEGMVRLGPWSRMTKDQTVINATNSVVKLRTSKTDVQHKKIDTIDAQGVKGTDKRPGKELEFEADNAHVQYNEDGRMEKLNGAGNAKLVSHGNGSNTTMAGNTVDLFFNTQKSQSELASAQARGNASIESKPTPDPKGATPDTKIIHADALDLHMKPGGKDVDRINTQSPGTLEFEPNQIARHRRVLKASEMNIVYGAKNEIQSFHAVKASTETYPSEDDRKKKKPNLAVGYTSSNVMDAAFDEKGELKSMKQAGDFKYAEGPRKAQADNATLENEHNVMNLDAKARIADDSGSTAADHIVLDQATGDFDATGHVSTTRLPDEKKTSSDLLDKDEPTQGLADHVVSANRNRLIHYMGNAVLWQASNRIQADRIDVDREKKSLVADGQVVSQFQDKPKKDDKTAKSVPAPPPGVFTVVKAPHMVYTDRDRQAIYTGGVSFWRGALTVKCATLKSFLNDNNSDADSRINHAFADGAVEIAQSTAVRKRVGTSDHAEYYTDEGKVILTGGQPQLSDTLRGNTSGDVLTYFTDDDRMINTGTSQKPVKSHLRRKTP